MKKGGCICSILLFMFTNGYSQKAISGKITSGTDNLPLSNISVTVKGTSTGVTSNNDGTYSIKAAGNATLVFSSSTFQKKEIAVNNRTEINDFAPCLVNECLTFSNSVEVLKGEVG